MRTSAVRPARLGPTAEGGDPPAQPPADRAAAYRRNRRRRSFRSLTPGTASGRPGRRGSFDDPVVLERLPTLLAVIVQGLTTERVSEAAAELADTLGLERLTVAAVARHFGVADASLYGHVRSREALLHKVAVLAAAAFGDRLALAVAGRSGRQALTPQRADLRSHRQGEGLIRMSRRTALSELG
ncbi:TetR/AcrR family transcriptional regulator [Micromonospora sp. CA-246542]|uniref:TetR/AcrR family transcriptional regulator n=1 Tax=Micromonospora sp. CA-246542 TaxID=3239959 RepID=UPI003D93643E